MPKLYKLAKKSDKFSASATVLKGIMGEDSYNNAHFIGQPMEDAYDAKKQAESDLKAAEADPTKGVIPMPDEDELERARRRRNARMRGGRDSTNLSQDEGFGG